MKKLILITFGGLMLTGCAMNKKCGITEKYDDSTILFMVDSSTVFENPNNLGVFYVYYDTVYIQATGKFDKKGSYKTSYKILNK